MPSAAELAFTEQVGVVARFDERLGLGEVATPDGRQYPFHCTSIADGSRRIAADAEVTFIVVPGRQGRWEATAVAAR